MHANAQRVGWEKVTAPPIEAAVRVSPQEKQNRRRPGGAASSLVQVYGCALTPAYYLTSSHLVTVAFF